MSRFAPPVPLTDQLVDLVAQAELETLPPAAVDAAKRAILDAVGVSLAAWDEPSTGIAVEYIAATNAPGIAGVVGSTLRLAPPGAALANGTLVHALDFDDTAWSFIGHPSAVFLPAALAVAEHQRSTGGELVAAYVAGFEVASRVGHPLVHVLAGRGWHLTSVVGVFGAAAAAGKLLRLDREQLKMTFGLAATQASGLKANFGWSAKPLHAGFAARAGVEAAFLVRQGLTATPDVFEHSLGFHAAFAGSQPDAPAQHALAIVEDPISFKRYPSCTGSHAAVDATLELRRKHKIVAKDVKRVICATTPEVATELMHPWPENPSQARFSMNFALAVALVHGRLALEHFSDAVLTEPAVRDVMSRCETIYDELDRPSGERAPAAEVEIRLAGNLSVKRRVECAKGTPPNSMKTPELVDKFDDCAARRLTDKGRIQALRELLLTLDRVDDVSQLTALATPEG